MQIQLRKDTAVLKEKRRIYSAAIQSKREEKWGHRC